MHHMDNDTLRNKFASYAPHLPEEPFLNQARRALAQEERRMRQRSRATYAVLLLLGVYIAVVSLGLVGDTLAFLNDLFVRSTAALSPTLSQLLTYGMTVVLGYLGRRRIRAFLVPW
jgi:hypothetical protein